MPNEPSNPPESLHDVPAQADDGTEPVLRQHYRRPPENAEPDEFRARLQAVAEEYGFRLDQLPGRLLIPQYDIVIIGDRASDLTDMEYVRQIIENNIRLDNNAAPRVLINEPLAGESASFLSWLNEANRRSTFVLIYVTNSFLNNSQRLQYLEQLYNESVSGPPERRFRIVPVFAPDADINSEESMSIPEAALFRNLGGLPLDRDSQNGQLSMRPMQIGNLRQLLRTRLNQRRNREEEQIEAIRDYAARARNQEGERLLQRMYEFLTVRMRLMPEEAKAELQPLYQMLGHNGVPPSQTNAASMIAQEVGSLQTPEDIDSGHATMATVSRGNSQIDELRSVGEASIPTVRPQQPQQLQQQQQQPQEAAAGASAAPINLNPSIQSLEQLQLGSANQVSIHGRTVHVHVTYVQQFVAGATEAHQHIDGGGNDDSAGAAGGGAAGHE